MHHSSVLQYLFTFNLGNISRCVIKYPISGDETHLNKHATILLSEVLMQMQQQHIVCCHKRIFVQHIFPLYILKDQFYNNSLHNVPFVTDPRCKLERQTFVFIFSVPLKSFQCLFSVLRYTKIMELKS